MPALSQAAPGQTSSLPGDLGKTVSGGTSPAQGLAQGSGAEPAAAGTHGQVVFSRSDDSPGESSAQSAAETAPAALAASVTNAMRAAPAFTAYDFAIHLQPATASLQVELRTTLRNDGAEPLAVLPLQLSSSLHFEHISEHMGSGGKALRFAVHAVDSDADHTGSLVEAAVALPVPLAPGAKASFTIDYAGTVMPSSARLDRLGTPAAPAGRSDWDRIGEGFSGLRGFGNTVWYPVASVPALLGDGARLFQEIGRQKGRNGGAPVSMAVTVEFMGDAPNVAVLDGRHVAVEAPASLPSASFPGVERVVLPATVLGFDVPSLMIASRVEAGATPLVEVAALPAHAAGASAYTAAGSLLDPLFHDWLGAQPANALLLLDLPIDKASPAQDGDALLLSLESEGAASQLAGNLSGPLAHVYFHSPRAWLREGVAGLMSVLWTERTEGRVKALEQLGGNRAALALAEPASPGVSGGEPLVSAQDTVFYRTKATYVLWMLRTLVGDAALGAALRAYDPAKDTTPPYFEQVLGQAVAAQSGLAARVSGAGQAMPGVGGLPGDLVKEPQRNEAGPEGSQGGSEQQNVMRAGQPDLSLFFKSWVYGDAGLPDLAISNVFSSRTGGGDQWLVSVSISNSGYVEADVPVVVRSASSTVTVQLRVPARGALSRRILLLGEPTEVDVNDGGVPEVESSVHRRVMR